MTCYSVQSRNRTFVKCYGILSFAKNMSKSIGKNVSSKYSQHCLDRAKRSATDALKIASKRVIQKTAEATGDLIDNKIADKITKILRNSLQNNSETITYEEENIRLNRGIQRGSYISPEKNKKLLMIYYYYNSIIIHRFKMSYAKSLVGDWIE